MAQSSKSKQAQSMSSSKESGLSFGKILIIGFLAILCYAGYDVYSGWVHTESVHSARQLQEEVLQVTAQFKDGDGYVDESDVDTYQEAAYEAVLNYEGGRIKDKGKMQDGVWVKFDNGFTMCFIPPIKGYLGADTMGSCLVSSFKPDMFPPRNDKYFEMINGTGSTLSGHYHSWHSELTAYSGVTLELVDNMGVKNTDQIILWTGHGFYKDGEGSYLHLGEHLKWGDFEYEKNRYRGYDTRTFIYNAETGQLAIGADFVKKYVENLDGALVYLGACCSGHDKKLGYAFTDAGAETVVCYTDPTHLSYHAKLLQAFIEAMCSQDSRGNYLSVRSAMQQAQAKVGEKDSPIDGICSEARIIGRGSYAFEGENPRDIWSPPKSSSSSNGSAGTHSTSSSQKKPADPPTTKDKLTKRTRDGMWFLPAQDGDYGYGSIKRAYISGDQLVFIGGGASFGRGQGDGVMMEDQRGKNSSFTLTGNTTYTYGGSFISKSECAKLLEKGTSFDWIQVDVSNGVATAVHL